MRIRDSQAAEMGREEREDFYRRAEAYLAAIPGGDAGSPALLVRDSEKRAATYGITTEAGIVQFACLTLAAGVPIDDLAEVRTYLRENPELPAEEKLAALTELLDAPEAEFVEEYVASDEFREPGE